MKLWQPVFAAAALLAGSSAWAETATGNFKTTIEIIKACEVNTHSGTLESPTGADINFGQYPGSQTGEITASGAQKDTGNALTVKCSKDTSFSIGLMPTSTSNNDGTGTMKRTDGDEKIAYSLHKDNTYNNAWGNEGSSLVRETGTGFGSSVNANNTTFTVYGKIEAGQLLDKPIGRYNDTVQVTVTY